MLSKSPKIWLAVATSLFILAVLHTSAQAKPLVNGYNKKVYDGFVERIIADFRRAGFVVIKEEVKDSPLREKEPVIETEVRIVMAPADFKKYFGELKLKNFFIQGEERQDGAFGVYLWVRYETGTNYIIFSSNGDDSLIDYGKEGGRAKQELVSYLFGLDCGTQFNGGLSRQIDSKLLFVSASSEANRSKSFSKGMREFLSSFYRELKALGFRFTLVENPPISEIRFFGFPKLISPFLPEPETKLIVIRSKGGDGAEMADIDVFDRATRKFTTISIVNLSPGEPMKELVKFAAKKIFYNFYTPDCSGYGGI